jgi:hypothetical protein
MTGIVLVATDNSKSTHYKCDGDTCVDDFLPGIAMAVTSALFSAINSVLADKLLSVDKKSALGVAEVSLFNSLVPFSILWIPMLATKEYERYDNAIYRVEREHAMALFVLCCVGLGVAKMIDRAAKFTIVTQQGAFFYAVADSVRKVMTAVLAIWIFSEEGSWKKYAALALTALAMCVYIYGTTRKQGLMIPGTGQNTAANAPLLDGTVGVNTKSASVGMPIQDDIIAMGSPQKRSQPKSQKESSHFLLSESSINELCASTSDTGLSQSPSFIVFPPDLFSKASQ